MANILIRASRCNNEIYWIIINKNTSAMTNDFEVKCSHVRTDVRHVFAGYTAPLFTLS